jgi:hypothetical protein
VGMVNPSLVSLLPYALAMLCRVHIKDARYLLLSAITWLWL